MSPRPTDLNGLIKNFVKIIRRIIGEDIELGISLSDKDLVVNVDPLQIEQVLMNLATNSRDAMPDGGRSQGGQEFLRVSLSEDGYRDYSACGG